VWCSIAVKSPATAIRADGAVGGKTVHRKWIGPRVYSRVRAWSGLASTAKCGLRRGGAIARMLLRDGMEVDGGRKIQAS